MSGSVQQEFFRWIWSIDFKDRSDTDRKLLSLLMAKYDVIEQLGTAGGRRAKAIGELIQTESNTLTPELPKSQPTNTLDMERAMKISEIVLGPFRGFATNESISFDKQYTLMYGPNGSGKSSFCEGLEYALLGSIEEAEARRIALSEYIRNAMNDSVVPPKVIGASGRQQRSEIVANQALYRFSFIEKNRIDSFARITATTASVQKDRIATLFGLDAFSDFVDGFTDEIDNRYIKLINQKAIDFQAETQKKDADEKRILKIDSELLENAEESTKLVSTLAREDIKTLDDLRLFLSGVDGVTGVINDLQKKRVEQIPIDLNAESVNSLPLQISSIENSITMLNNELEQLETHSSLINFKDLYTAVSAIAADPKADKSTCPACKTPIENVVQNPFEYASAELGKLANLSTLQAQIQELCIVLSENVKTANKTIQSISNVAKTAGFEGRIAATLTEFTFTDIGTISIWKNRLEAECTAIRGSASKIAELNTLIATYNGLLARKRAEKAALDSELKKNQELKSKLDMCTAKRQSLAEEKDKLISAVSTFAIANKEKIAEIEEEGKKIAIHQLFADSYRHLIAELKKYRNGLAPQFAIGLSEKVREFYNIINGHDPDFERIEKITLPAAPGDKIVITFKGDRRPVDALRLLSEGHIKVLGLSILLAKAVNENVGFLIFDDLVNAMDDDHRDGVAELLMKHVDLKNRQFIITCHGEQFIGKIEDKLGASVAGKDVNNYRFYPADSIERRGVRISVGDSKHYLLIAKRALDEDARKAVASHCRQAVESIAEQLWNKFGNKMNISLSVKMRSPNARAELSSVVEALIREAKKIKGLEELVDCLQQLKKPYIWNLLNKGTHEQGNLPEFEIKDVSELLALCLKLEDTVGKMKWQVSIA